MSSWFQTLTDMILKTLLIAMSLLVITCGKRVYSELLYEEGHVISSAFYPAHDDINVGRDADGNLDISTTHVPERYTMRFRCQHGEFSVSSQSASQLYKQLRPGDPVIITYRRVDRIKEKDGVEVERHFASWDFITAKRFDPNGPTEH